MNPTAPPPVQATPADQYAQLKSAVLGAQTNTAPGASPIGSFPELDRLNASSHDLTKLRLTSAAPNYNSGVDAAAAEAEAKANAQAAAQKLKDLSDPNKYQQVETDDGGFKFYDPTGQEISASDFARVHNTTPNEVLKHSQNPIDKAYQQDFAQLQDYIRNKADSKNDPAAAAAAKATEDQVKKAFGIDLHTQNPAEVIAAFKAAYPTVYGGHQAGPQGTSTLLPNSTATKATKKLAGKSGVGTTGLSGSPK